MKQDAKIYVAGHRGLVGSAIVRELKRHGYHNLILKPFEALDLRRQADVETFFQETKPDYVFLAAAKVGGILANNTYPADFLYDNLMIETNIIHTSYLHGVKKLLFLGSSCIYPKFAEQPIKEEYLLTGALEPTNEAYAIAKITGNELCKFYRKQYGCDFISVMPTNLYGIHDNFDLHSAHVLPALLRKFHEAKKANASTVKIWGTGLPKREFLYVDDLAQACLYVMQHYSDATHLNIGTGEDISIQALALKIKAIVGFEGNIVYDLDKPDGTLRKCLDVDKIHALGWHHQTSLEEGLRKTYAWYLKTVGECL